jgi:hypothetical protein
MIRREIFQITIRVSYGSEFQREFFKKSLRLVLEAVFSHFLQAHKKNHLHWKSKTLPLEEIVGDDEKSELEKGGFGEL